MTANFRNFYTVHQCFLFAHFFSGVLTKYPFRLPRRTKQRTNRPVTQSCKNRKKGKIHYLRVRLASSFFSKKVPKRKPFVFLWNSHFHTNVFAYSTKVIAISKTQRGQRCYRLRLTYQKCHRKLPHKLYNLLSKHFFRQFGVINRALKDNYH